jgi:hypothetical protein
MYDLWGILKARRTDNNQAEIVDALRKVGASVAITSRLGDGFPDIVVGYMGQNAMAEIKDGNAGLTEDEMKFFQDWRGNLRILRSVEDAMQLLYAMRLGNPWFLDQRKTE